MFEVFIVKVYVIIVLKCIQCIHSLCMIIYMFVQSNHEFINTTHIFIHYVMQWYYEYMLTIYNLLI